MELRYEDVPEEPVGSVATGLAIHLGPAVVYVTMLVLLGRSFATVVGGSLAIAAVYLLVVLRLERTAPCVELPEASQHEWRTGLAKVFATGIGAGGMVVVGGWALLSLVSPIAGHTTSWSAIAVAVLLTDYAYYWTHREFGHGTLFSIWDRVHGTYYEQWQLNANDLAKHRIALPVRAL